MTGHGSERLTTAGAQVLRAAGKVARHGRRAVGRVARSALRLVRARRRRGVGDPRSAPVVTETAAVDPVIRLRDALALVAEAERVEPALPQRDEAVTLLARDRVVRRPEIPSAVAGLAPPGQRGGWRDGDEGVVTLSEPVAADLVVLAKLDLQSRPKLRAVYAERGLTLMVQPPTSSRGSGVGRAVRAHEVVEGHAPHLIPPMLGHGALGDGTPYVVERWLSGRPLGGARQLTDVAAEILAGLAAVHRGYGVTRVPLSEHWGDAFGERWRATAGTGLLPDDLARWVEELIVRDGTLRRSFIHGDLVASNVLTTEDGVVLVDWEQAHEGVLMNDAAKLHLFGDRPEELLETILSALGNPSSGEVAGDPSTEERGTAYRPEEELALCHAQLISLYPRRRARLSGHARAQVYEAQVRRQVERLEQVRSRATS